MEGIHIEQLAHNRLQGQGCLDDTSTHKTTKQHLDPHGTSTQRFVYFDILLLPHFDPVTFYDFDIPSL
jgi:hypothetical protein